MRDQILNNGAANWRTVEPFEECCRQLNQRCFTLTHGLADHPLFSFDALLELAKSTAERPQDLYINAGDVKVTDKWDHVPMVDRPVAEVLHRIESAGAWIIMKHVEVNPAYATILNEFTDFIRKLTAPDQKHLLKSPEMQVLITSPNRVTMFHIDYEVNFLVQIRGSKQVWVCDPNDRSAVTQEEIERFYVGHHSAATYKPGVESRATRFDFNPGQGVHIPTHAAHWVQNDNNISVSLSLNFELPHSIHRYPSIANYGLRRLGLTPRPPGQSKIADRLKSAAGGVAFAGFQLWKRVKGGAR